MIAEVCLRRLHWVGLCLSVVLYVVSTSLVASAQSHRLHVDLTDAARNIYHAKLSVPAKPGAMTLVFPKWIPGNHRPSGPIAALTGIHMEAAAKPLLWQRDDVDMYAFHVTVPEGATAVEVSLDAITSN